jgi:hypothetical protein
MRLEPVRSWWLGLGRPEKAAVAAWALLLAVVSVKAAGWPHDHSLYPVFATAARNWRAGTDLYRQTGPEAAGLDVYRYSPLIAALLTPLSFLPDRLGSVLWRLLNAAVCLGGLAWWSRSVLPGSVSRSERALLFLLVLPLAVGNLNNAQSNPLVLGLLLGSLAAAGARRWTLASGGLALACLFKLYPIAVGLLLVVRYPRPLAGRLALALAVGLALPFLLQHPDYVAGQYASWVEYLHGEDRSGFPLESCYRDLPLLCRRWLVPLSPHGYLLVQVLAGGGMAAVCLACRRRGWPKWRLLTLLTGLGSCWMTVFGPATESCTYILVGPSAAWALVDAWQRSGSVGVRLWLGVAYGLLVATYMSAWFPSDYRLQPLGLQPLAGLMLLAHLLATALHPAWAAPPYQLLARSASEG